MTRPIFESELNPANGILHHGFLINPRAKLIVRMAESLYGSDGFHGSWTILCLYNEKLTTENAAGSAVETVNGHEIAVGTATLGSKRLLELRTHSVYPDDNLWLFVIGNSVSSQPQLGTADFATFDFLDPDSLYKYTLRSVLRIMREDPQWTHGDFRLFIPSEHAERIGGEYGQIIRPKGQKKDFSEMLPINEVGARGR